MSKIIIANWKMNLSIKDSLNFIKRSSNKQKVIIAAPFTFLASLKAAAGKKKISLAGQTVSAMTVGAYTGEISASMLKEAGCTFCLVGHSERRIYWEETDLRINQQIQQLLAMKINPILCIGENASERKRGLTKKVLGRQLLTCLKNIKPLDKVMIAYEPVWAISTFQKGKVKKSAEISDIIEAHKYIKAILKNKNVKVLYGGTVNPQNAGEILNLAEVDGALVGGASLNIFSFNAIIKSIK